MYHKSRAQFRLKPCGLRRHDIAGVGDIHYLFHGNWIKGEGCTHLAGIDTAFQFAKTAKTSHKVYALAGTQVSYLENVLQDKARGDVNVKHTYRIRSILSAGLGIESVPFSIQIKGELMGVLRAILFRSLLLHREVL